MYDIFGKYGAIRQIRLGTSNHTRGTAYVVYEDIFEAKAACENLNGFHVAGMYLIVSHYSSPYCWREARRRLASRAASLNLKPHADVTDIKPYFVFCLEKVLYHQQNKMTKRPDGRERRR